MHGFKSEHELEEYVRQLAQEKTCRRRSATSS
jgi:hypothetical protein